MYVVHGLILTIMGLAPTLEGRLSTSGKACRYNINLLPEEVTDQFPTSLYALLDTNKIEPRKEQKNNLEEKHIKLNEVWNFQGKTQIKSMRNKNIFNYAREIMNSKGKKGNQYKFSNLRNHLKKRSYQSLTDNSVNLRYHQSSDTTYEPEENQKIKNKSIKAVIFISEPNLKIKLASMKGIAKESISNTADKLSLDAENLENKKYTELLSGVTDDVPNHNCYSLESLVNFPYVINRTDGVTLPIITIQRDIANNVFSFDPVVNRVDEVSKYLQGTNDYSTRSKKVKIQKWTFPTSSIRRIDLAPNVSNYKLRFELSDREADQNFKYSENSGCQCQDEGNGCINVTDPVVSIGLESSMKEVDQFNNYPQEVERRDEYIYNQPKTTKINRFSGLSSQYDANNTLNFLPLNEVSGLIEFQEIETSDDCTCDKDLNDQKEDEMLLRTSIKYFQDFTDHTLRFRPSIKEFDPLTKYSEGTDGNRNFDEDTKDQAELTTLPISTFQDSTDTTFVPITLLNDVNESTKCVQVEGSGCGCDEGINDQQTSSTTSIQFVQELANQSLKEFDHNIKYAIIPTDADDSSYVVECNPSLDHINKIKKELLQGTGINCKKKTITLKRISIRPVQYDIGNTLRFDPSLAENEVDSVQVEGQFKNNLYSSDSIRDGFRKLETTTSSYDSLLTVISKSFEKEIDPDIKKLKRESTVTDDDDDDQDKKLSFDVTGVNDEKLITNHEVEQFSTFQPLNKYKHTQKENRLFDLFDIDGFKEVKQRTTKHVNSRKKCRRLGKKQRKHHLKLKKKVTKNYSKTTCNSSEKEISLSRSTTDSSLSYSCDGNYCFFYPIWNSENNKQPNNLKKKQKLAAEKGKTIIEEEMIKLIEHPTSTDSEPIESVNIKIKKEPPVIEDSNKESYNFSNFSPRWDLPDTDSRNQILFTYQDYIENIKPTSSDDRYLSELFRKLIDEDEKIIDKDRIMITSNVKEEEYQSTAQANDDSMTLIIDVEDDEKVPTSSSKDFVTDPLSTALAEMMGLLKMRIPMVFTNGATPSYNDEMEKYSAAIHSKNQPITTLISNIINKTGYYNFPVTTPINFKPKEVESSQKSITINKVDWLLENIFEICKHLSMPQKKQQFTQVNFFTSTSIRDEYCDEINSLLFSTWRDDNITKSVHTFDRHTVEETMPIFCETITETYIPSERTPALVSKSESTKRSERAETTCYSVNNNYHPTLHVVSRDDKKKDKDIFPETFETSCYHTSDISNPIKTNTPSTKFGDYMTPLSYPEDNTVKMICYPVSDFNEKFNPATSRTEENLELTTIPSHCNESHIPTVLHTRNDEMSHTTKQNRMNTNVLRTVSSDKTIPTTEPVETNVSVSEKGDYTTHSTFYSPYEPISLFEKFRDTSEIKNVTSTLQYHSSNKQNHWENEEPEITKRICNPFSDIKESPEPKPTEIETEMSVNCSITHYHLHDAVTLTYRISSNEHQTLEKKKHSGNSETAVATSIHHGLTSAMQVDNGHEVISTIPSKEMVQFSHDASSTSIPVKPMPENEPRRPCYCPDPSYLFTYDRCSVSSTIMTQSSHGKSSTISSKKKHKMRYYPPFAFHRIWPNQWESLELNPKYNDLPHFDVLPLDYGVDSPSEPTCRTDTYQFRNHLDMEHETSLGVFVTNDEHLPPGFYKLDELKKLRKSLPAKSMSFLFDQQTPEKILTLNKETRHLNRILHPRLIYHPVLSRHSVLPNYIIKRSYGINNGLRLLDKKRKEINPVLQLPRRLFLHSPINDTKNPRSVVVTSKLKIINNNANLFKNGDSKIAHMHESLYNRNAKLNSKRRKKSNLDNTKFYWNKNLVPKKSMGFLYWNSMKNNFS